MMTCIDSNQNRITFLNSVPQHIGMGDCGLFIIRYIHDVLIIGTLCPLTITGKDDYFNEILVQNKLFQFYNNEIGCLRRNLKKLIMPIHERGNEKKNLIGDSNDGDALALDMTLKISQVCSILRSVF